ncbi:MAG: Hpt domain-containing protein, partial [Candidatus Omnitrophica bacterium]|nr:Hpt domain-containing protein [Candidatus Omnitrophota bacterium]
MSSSKKPTIESIEEQINKLASGLILLDCASTQDIEEFLQSLCELQKGLSGADSVLKGVCTLIEIGKKEFKQLSDLDTVKINAFLTIFISSLQNFVRSVKQKKDLSNYEKNFEEELRQIITGDQNETKKAGGDLSETQASALPDFISNAETMLEEIESDLLRLEKEKEDAEIFNRIFRDFHSIKGECNILGLINISSLTHKIEDVLEKLRAKTLIVNSEIINALLAAVDAIKKHLILLSSDFRKASQENFLSIVSSLEKVIRPNLETTTETEEKGDVDNKKDQEKKEEEFIPKVPQ